MNLITVQDGVKVFTHNRLTLHLIKHRTNSGFHIEGACPSWTMRFRDWDEVYRVILADVFDKVHVRWKT